MSNEYCPIQDRKWIENYRTNIYNANALAKEIEKLTSNRIPIIDAMLDPYELNLMIKELSEVECKAKLLQRYMVICKDTLKEVIRIHNTSQNTA